ncbi:MAG: hypothetical protein FWF84_05075 [Kiritimatiellaeota bacterium]|nr:hypothetical protein [Kiritimatiellota bacterium]
MSDNQLRLVALEQAKRLKAAGFGWEADMFFYVGLPGSGYAPSGHPQNSYRDNHNYELYKVSAPTVALALKWARDEMGMGGHVYPVKSVRDGSVRWCVSFVLTDGAFNTYDDAESALLDAVLGEIEQRAAR